MYILLQVFSCFDEDNQRTLAVKEIEVDHNWSNDTKKVYSTASVYIQSVNVQCSIWSVQTHC